MFEPSECESKSTVRYSFQTVDRKLERLSELCLPINQKHNFEDAKFRAFFILVHLVLGDQQKQ